LVIPKQGMHEKLIFIDEGILWSGSLNPLSFSNTQEVMERRKSPAVVSDFSKTLRLKELVDEYRGGRPTCPICGSWMLAAEGRDDPYYWKCIEVDCYTRSIDEAPIGEEILCHNCGGPVEYGTWGEADAWRCVENRHHHQKIARTHLRLPKMQEVVPKADLRRMQKKWGLASSSTGPNRLFS
jgi:hypothetical protein